MPCTSPLKGVRSPNGTVTIFGHYMPGYDFLEVPCGQCLSCRLDRARSWAIRCKHESQMHEKNSFLTLTYNQENLPADRSLDVKHFQDFMKRLRKSQSGKTIRFFHCGEYGDLNKRPHYHACIFGHDFMDKELVSVSKRGDRLYKSEQLQKLWPFGFASVGKVTFQSAGYVARYITKKITGEKAKDHYWSDPDEHGEIFKIKPEYTTMSRRPGIGKTWFEKYGADVYPNDHVVIEGKKHPPPRYYDKLLEEQNPDLYEQIKAERIARANSVPWERWLKEQSTARAKQRDECLNAKANRFLTRDLK